MTEPQDPTENIEAGAPEPQTPPAPSAEQLQKERDDVYDRLLRKSAEFDNFRKRVERERKEFTEWAAADVLSDLLAVMDDFDRALAAQAPPEAQPYIRLSPISSRSAASRRSRPSARTSIPTATRPWPTM
jgi:molecular chaperone GrpE (heat shock protein)